MQTGGSGTSGCGTFWGNGGKHRRGSVYAEVFNGQGPADDSALPSHLRTACARRWPLHTLNRPLGAGVGTSRSSPRRRPLTLPELRPGRLPHGQAICPAQCGVARQPRRRHEASRRGSASSGAQDCALAVQPAARPWPLQPVALASAASRRGASATPAATRLAARCAKAIPVFASTQSG